MRRIITYLTLAAALALGVERSSAQVLRLGVDFDMLFDNKEYSSMTFDESGTLFSARLTPKIGVAWSERNELMLGVDMVQDFGHNSKFLSDANVQIYYAYRAPRIELFAGIFPRSEMRGLASPLFFDRDYLYYHNRIGGVMARYKGAEHPNSYVEFAFDYTGMRDFDVRESFMIMSSGRHNYSLLYYGYDLLVGHYGKDYNEESADGVVDNVMVVPHIGVDIEAGEFDIDLRLSYVQSLQRDRHNENKWQTPLGGELYASISRWGVTLSNRLYYGGNLLPYYDRYAKGFYHGSPFYSTTERWYNTISAAYRQSFFNRTVHVDAGITMEYDGTGWGTRQWLQVCVDLDYGISLKRKQQYIE